MSFNNFSVSNIVERIYLFLPSRFTRDSSSELYKFMSGISEVFKINSDQIDELFRQTNLTSASGEYVDDFITGMSGLGRKNAEADDTYKDRYKNRIYVHNSTKTGLQQVVIDITGKSPLGMYSSSKRGAYTNARYYYNDDDFRSTYGTENPQPFTGYIHFKVKPSEEHIDELCKVINEAKASGITIYLYYPNVVVGYGNGGYGTFEYGI